MARLPEHYDFGFVKMRAKYGKMQMEDGKLSIPVDMTYKWRRGRLWLFGASYWLLCVVCKFTGTPLEFVANALRDRSNYQELLK